MTDTTPGTCDAVQAAAARYREKQAHRREWAEMQVTLVGPEEARKRAVAMLDAAAASLDVEGIRRAGL